MTLAKAPKVVLSNIEKCSNFQIYQEDKDIWQAPATVDEEKSKEQEMDDYFDDLFL